MEKKKIPKLQSWIIGVTAYTTVLIMTSIFIAFIIGGIILIIVPEWGKTITFGQLQKQFPTEYLLAIAVFIGATLQHFAPLDSDELK